MIGIAIRVRREPMVGYWRNDRLDPGNGQRIPLPVGVECPVGKELAAGQPFDQCRCAVQIESLPGQQPEIGQAGIR